MSGNPTSNVVPMAKAPAPASAPGTTSWGGPPWAMNPIYPIPPGPWSSGGLPWGASGCCPPGGMDALMQCYCDVQAATAFICSVMVSCVQNNPAVTAAIIAAIEASGSSLPLTGVTNGSAAQPGQVGEFIGLTGSASYPTGASTQTISVGVLQPGSWQCWAECNFNTAMNSLYFQYNPVPAGFSGVLAMELTVGGGASAFDGLLGPATANISVPTLIVLQSNLTAAAAGMQINNFYAYRIR